MKRRFVGLMAAALLAGLVPVVSGGGRAAADHGGSWHVTERVSVSSSGGNQGDSMSDHSSISGDGRFVAFYSFASNLVAGDTNGTDDVFVRDRVLGVTERVSVSSAGVEGNRDSFDPSISDDGRFVAFWSFASNLVPDDTNGTCDVFVRDRVLGVTERISVSSAGVEGNHESERPSISSDGRFVAFESDASNLVAGDTKDMGDVFVRDRLLGVTERVSVDSAGVEGNGRSFTSAVSGDGRFVVFSTQASNLVPGDTNHSDDVFVRDRLLGVTERASVSSSDVEGNHGSLWSSISADGRFVAFWSSASNLVAGDTNDTGDVFVRDRVLGVTERVSVSSAGVEGNDSSIETSTISDDGRFVAFQSDASNLVAGDTNDTGDVFVRDRVLGVTERVSVDSAGVEGNDNRLGLSEARFPFSVAFGGPEISADGRSVAFSSEASNLVTGDTNGTSDVFVAESSALPSPTTITTAGGGSLPSIGWLATGDSYSSGEGLEDAGVGCERSLSAYVPQTRDRLTGAGWVIDPSPFVPCTGYLVGNLYNETSKDVIGRVKGDAGEGSLYEQSGLAADAQLDLITFSFGGNDIAFSQVILDCLGADKDWIPGVAGDRRCDITEAQLVKRVTDLTNGVADFGYLSRFLIDERGSGGGDDVHGSLADFYAYVYDRHLAASNGHLVVVGYPRIFADSRSWSSWTGKRCWGIHKDDADMLGRVAEDLDDTISDQVDEAAAGGRNIHYLSVIDEFEDHELCGSEEDWVNSLNDMWHGEGRRPQRAFHPNGAGHDAETDLLEAFLKQLDWPITLQALSDLDAKVLAEGELAPDFIVATRDGGTFSLWNHLANDGRPVLLNLWASWATPSRYETAAIEAASQLYPGVAFVGVALADTEADVWEFVEEMGLTYTIGFDRDHVIQDAYPVLGLPATFLVSGNGVIVKRTLGLVTEESIAADLATFFGE